MAFIWIFYDISKDAARNHISKMCKRAGLRRIQKSVFFGNIPDVNVQLLMHTLHKRINPLTDRLLILPDDKTVLKRLKAFGQLTNKGMSDFWTRRIHFI
jgi:CRISPR-associated protein Cas2